MGSGGGFFSGKPTPEALRRQIREAESAADDVEHAQRVNTLLAQLLAEYNERDQDGIQGLLDELRSALRDDAELDVEIRFGGSVAKHTYVDGLSDVDALVFFRREQVKGESPGELREILADLVRRRLRADTVDLGAMAVTVRRGNLTLQLLPALRADDAMRIPARDGSSWATIQPRAFAAALTEANRSLGGKLVPCIKLAKSIIGGLPEQQRISGYHCEALALEVFRHYAGSQTHRDILRHFFTAAAARVLAPIADPTGQSVAVDESLGGENSIQRKVIAESYARISRRMQNADGARDLTLWQDLLDGE